MTQRLLCPQCGTPQPTQAERDGRAAWWRVRVRLYAKTKQDEPVGDSDPERPPDAAGSLVVHGLPAVAAELTGLAELYHSETIADLSDAVLRHRLKSLRPTLSRNKGEAVWRVPYATADTREWLARVDIQRCGEQEGA